MSFWQALRLALWTNGALTGAAIEEDIFASPPFLRTADLFVGRRVKILGRSLTVPRGRGMAAWMNALRKDGARRVRLHFVYPTKSALPRYHIGAFEGGGPIPVIIAVRTKSTSWWGLQSRPIKALAPPKPPLQRIEKPDDIRAVLAAQNERRKNLQGISRPMELHITRLVDGVIDEPPIDLESAHQALRAALIEAITVTTDDKRAELWRERFQFAIGRLNGKNEIPGSQPIPWLSDRARMLVDAASHAWCFGGMGSFMDRAFVDDEEKKRYVTLCDHLANVIDRSWIAAVDSL